MYTPIPSIFAGGYFYNYETMHLTQAALSLPSVDKEDSFTNNDHPGFLCTLSWMHVILRYQSEPCECSIPYFPELL